MIDLSKVRNFYVACGYTDLRLGIDGLAAVVTQQFGGHLDEESLFLFCGRRSDRIKALYWSGDGYILLYKRLSNGRFQWPRSEAELRLLDPQSFRWLMEGLKVEQKTAIRKGKPKDFFLSKSRILLYFILPLWYNKGRINLFLEENIWPQQIRKLHTLLQKLRISFVL